MLRTYAVQHSVTHNLQVKSCKVNKLNVCLHSSGWRDSGKHQEIHHSFLWYSFTVQSGDMGYSCKKQGLFETAKFKYSHGNRIEISCQDQSRKPEHTEHLSLQGNKILKLHKNRIRVLNPNVFVILKYNSLQVFMAVAERMGISFARQAPLSHHSCYQAVDLFETGRVPSYGNQNV